MDKREALKNLRGAKHPDEWVDEWEHFERALDLYERGTMKKPVCAVYDKLTSTFDSPFVVNHTGEAIRQFVTLKRDPKTRFGQHPQDFDLFQIAEYDDQTGNLSEILPHPHLQSGAPSGNHVQSV